ncbi:efflux RND transporter permease subunit, partial [Acinetobacter baumannii]
KGSEVLVRNLARANTLEDLANTVVANKNGAPVLLRQLAEVKFGGPIKRGDGSLNGKPAVILSIEKQPNANTVTLTAEIIKAIDDVKK